MATVFKSSSIIPSGSVSSPPLIIWEITSMGTFPSSRMIGSGSLSLAREAPS